MGIALWKSISFFLMVGWFATWIFPSSREMGILHTKAKQWDRAEFYLAKQYFKDPLDKLNTIRYFDLLVYKGLYERSDYLAGKIESNYQNHKEVLIKLADYWRDRLAFDRSAIVLNKVLNLSPDDEVIRRRYLAYLYQRQDWGGLVEYYEGENSRKIDIEDMYELGRLYLLLDRWESAINVYKMILKSNIHEFDAALKIFEIHEHQGNIYEAVIVLKNQLNLKNKDMNTQLYLLDRLRLHDADGYYAYLQQFNLQNPSSFELKDKLYNELVQRQEKKKAIGLLLDMLLLKPANIRLLEELSYLYYETGDKKKAYDTLQKVHDKGVGTHRSYHLMGDLLTDQNKTIEAKFAYKKALELLTDSKRDLK